MSNISAFSSLQTDPLRGFRFRAQFLKPANGNPIFDDSVFSFNGGFTNIDGLSIVVQPITYREGGYNATVHNIPGTVSYSPITMSRGVLYGQDQAITWMRGLFAATSGEGIALPATTGPQKTGTIKDFRCDIKITVLDHPSAGENEDASPRMVFLIRNAWLSGLSYRGLNAGANELHFETLTFVHEGLGVYFTDEKGKPATSSTGAPAYNVLT
jgi:phage tail-like protein